MAERVVVVGSGAAGLTAALTAAQAGHDVMLLTKGTLGESNSLYAQGGVAAALFDDDSVEAHIADTLAAGAGLSDPVSVRVLCQDGPARIHELIALGAEFDRCPDGRLARGLEAAHSVPRVVHAGGDATGRAIIATLVRATLTSRITVWEHCFARDLVIGNGSVTGIRIIRDGREHVIAASAVIIASGGAGQLYRHSTNPLGATGDGVAMALRAGVRLIDAEFVQFHPTTLAVPGTPLISEAVRGEGAVLLDARGERFMMREHPDAELAPRDVVARAIARQMQLQGDVPVLLDARALGDGVLRRRFPGFVALAAAHGFNPSEVPVPVTPAAHYWMGGIEVDDDGRTAVRGLYAVGEAACTRAHGANRLASNSLLEALVTGHRAALALEQATPAALPGARARPTDGHRAITRGKLQQVMWQWVGLHRDAAGLATAGAVLAEARVQVSAEHRVADLETANLLQLAREVVAAASARTESIGAHHRSDADMSSRQPEREVSIAC
ncbi:L-aspartate oxidase [Salinibacterium sp. dk2585]|uniref:L-aspartate oxidase n=1 Tax=unclassified Salinibacterium TaxID=2632331 RepID=UPI0011C248EE|nr:MULTISPECIES: L-aspartate oxidase [unclassified Salinibacterium]QEE61388.1 L-aspartate oxidase [Salinibacterium sp. dk2585]TXK54065.1 L-aspartate oxidase [Salinibacterium sp. dk5596]